MSFTAIEMLESRLCLSATLSDGTLLVEGSPENDTIRVTLRRGDFVVRQRGAAAQSFPESEVQRVVVNSLEGNDLVRVDRTTLPLAVDAGAGNDIVVGALGDDVLVGGEGNDALNGRAGDDQLFGLAGTNRLLGGRGADTADIGADLLSGVESRPEFTAAEVALIAGDAGLTVPAGGFVLADVSATAPVFAGGGGGGGGIVASGDTSAAIDTGAPGSILLDASGQAIDQLAPTTTTSSSIANDVLVGSVTTGSVTLGTSTLGSQALATSSTTSSLLTNSTIIGTLTAGSSASSASTFASSSATSSFFG